MTIGILQGDFAFGINPPIIMDELKSRPLSERPISLKTSVNIGIAALEMEIQVPPTEKGDK